MFIIVFTRALHWAQFKVNMLYIDPLLSNNYEISNYTTGIAKQWLSSNYSKRHECNKCIVKVDVGYVFSTCSVPRFHTQDKFLFKNARLSAKSKPTLHKGRALP
jgi:hypothetical protein